MGFDEQSDEVLATLTRGPKLRRLPLTRSRRRLAFEKRLRIWFYLLSVPSVVFGSLLLRAYEASWQTIGICEGGFLLAWTIGISVLTEQIVRPLQTLANVVSALREDDYSFRARGARRDDALGELALEINSLAGSLQGQRSRALEAMALLERVMASMESPVLAFDNDDRLLMLNAAGERAFGTSSALALGKRALDLNLGRLAATADGELIVLGSGNKNLDRWVVKRSSFRLHGVSHTLLMLSDVSKALREEERVAWERLIRVLGHEINNSLTPIKSIAGSLRSRLATNESSADFEGGLSVIENRAESLNRFLQAYRQLMGLPTPKLQPISLVALIARIAHLETRHEVIITPSEDVLVNVDADQIEQTLINLVRNAVDAVLSPDAVSESPRSVELRWESSPSEVIISILDSGPGLTNPANLFVPFYTTKPNGTGIGLILAQQIAEAHSGSVRLSNRSDKPGCIAELRLPRGRHVSS